MKTLKAAVSALLFILLLSFPAAGQSSETKQSQETEEKFTRWEELYSGQDGKMCTVFEGTKVECIKVKYIDKIPHPANPKEKAIIIALLDKKRAPKNATPIAGSSGSPVYFKFKVRSGWFRTRTEFRHAGAAAFMFTDFPIGRQVMGVTPIEAVISGSVTVTTAINLPQTVDLSALGLGERNIFWLPICVGSFGVNDDNPMCFNRQAAPEQPNTPTTPVSRKPEPGDSVTVWFPYEGGAICTVTYVMVNRFWACGHSILRGSGTSALNSPSYRTRIAMIVDSGRNSYKLYGEDLEFFGTIIKNTPFGIEGVIHEYGKKP